MTRQIAAGQYQLELDGQRLIIRDGNGQIVETIDDINAVTEIRLPNGGVVQIGAIADAFADPSIAEVETAAGGDAAGAENSGGIFAPLAIVVNLGGLNAVGGQSGTSLSYSTPAFPENRIFDNADGADAAAPDAKVYAPIAQAMTLETDEDRALKASAKATDPENDPLLYTLVDAPTHGAIEFQADGSFTYRPNLNYNGPDSFTYRANDGSEDSNVAKVDITVTPVNDAPVADDDAIVTDEDSSVPGQVTAADVDSPTLGYQIIDGPAHGTVDFKADGSFIYQPDANYNGPDGFTYRANDGSEDSNIAKVDITVNPVNDAPTVVTTDGSVITHIVSHADDLIVNGSFEDLNGQPLANGAWDVYQNLPGWHTGRTENSKAPGVEVQHGTVITAADGGNYVELDSDNFQGKAPTSTNATIYQDVKTTEGESYTLSFAYSPRVTTSGTHTNDVEVWWDGQKIATLSGDKQGWTTYTFEVEGGDHRSRLEFIAAGTADTLGGFIDSVSLHEAPSIDMESVLHPAVNLADIDSTMLSKITVETAGFQSGDHLDLPASSLFTITTVQHGGDVTLEIVAKSGTADIGDFQTFLDGLNFATNSDDAGTRSITYTAVDDHGLASDPAVAHIAVSIAYDVNAGDLTAAHSQLGDGNDTVHLDHAMSTDLDAGSGYDTVRLEQANMNFGHADAAKLHNIEAIDATSHGDNTISLTVSEVLSLTDDSNQLRVIGNAGDTLHLANEGVHQWQVTDTDADFTTLTFDNGIHQAVIVVSNDLELLVA